VAGRWGGGKREPPFRTLVNTMLNACVLDIANIALDEDRRTPSITQLIAALGDSDLVAKFREDFAVWNLQPTGVSSPDVLRVLEEEDRQEVKRRRDRFDQLAEEAVHRWTELEASPTLSSFRKMRDKLIAHNELWHDGTQYRPLDV